MESFIHFLAEDVRETPPDEPRWRQDIIHDLSRGIPTSLLVYADWLEDNNAITYADALRGKMLSMHYDDAAHSSRSQPRHDGPATWAEVGQVLGGYDWFGANQNSPADIHPYDAGTWGLPNPEQIINAFAGHSYSYYRNLRTVQIWMTDRSDLPEWAVGWLRELTSVDSVSYG